MFRFFLPLGYKSVLFESKYASLQNSHEVNVTFVNNILIGWFNRIILPSG